MDSPYATNSSTYSAIHKDFYHSKKLLGMVIRKKILYLWLTCIHLQNVSIKYSILLSLLLPSTKETFITTLVLGEIMQIRLFILFIETNILCTITFQILTRNKKFWFFSYQRKLVFSHGKKDLKIQENKFSFVKSMLKCSCYLESLMQSVISLIRIS